MSSRLKPSAVCVRSFVPNEKKSACCGDRVGQEARPRQLDHRADEEVLARDALLLGDAQDQRLDDLQLALVVDQRHHDLELRRVAEALGHGALGAHDRADLHLVDLRMQDRQPAAARAEHRVDLAQRVRARVVLVGRQELVQRRVEQADRDRQPVHRLEHLLEVLLLQRQQLVERRDALVDRLREDHLAHLRLAVGGHEHVLGAAQADARGAELARLARILGRVGVRAHAEPAQLVGPLEHALEVHRHLRLDERDVVDRDLAGRAVDRDAVALARGRSRRRAAASWRGRCQARSRRSPPAAPCRGRRAPRGWPCRPRRSGSRARRRSRRRPRPR